MRDRLLQREERGSPLGDGCSDGVRRSWLCLLGMRHQVRKRQGRDAAWSIGLSLVVLVRFIYELGKVGKRGDRLTWFDLPVQCPL